MANNASYYKTPSKKQVKDVTLLSVLEKGVKKNPKVEFVFLSSGKRVTLKDIWVQVRISHIIIHVCLTVALSSFFMQFILWVIELSM